MNPDSDKLPFFQRLILNYVRRLSNRGEGLPLRLALTTELIAGFCVRGEVGGACKAIAEVLVEEHPDGERIFRDLVPAALRRAGWEDTDTRSEANQQPIWRAPAPPADSKVRHSVQTWEADAVRQVLDKHYKASTLFRVSAADPTVVADKSTVSAV